MPAFRRPGLSARGLLTRGLVCLLALCGFETGVLEAGALTSPAAAGETVLCTGYAGCAGQGMDAAGYAHASTQMYWLMYAGHNCTNYVAYRMVRSGMANTRPWSGDGNATSWGTANSSRTDDVPAVGSVAWWPANVPPGGSSGHVAYVEQVLSPNEIVVSQDSWHGDFSWARITRSSGYWPRGFIHFNDAPLTNLAAPTLAGEPKVGSTLVASPGSWDPGDARLRYVWRAGRRRILGASGPTLTLGPAQQAKRISVRVRASKIGYPAAVASSARTGSVAPGQIVNEAPPTVSGTPQVDATLTGTAGSWGATAEPLTTDLQWLADGVPIVGADSPTLQVDPTLVGRAISLRVTASAAGYDDVAATSQTTPAVVPGTFTRVTRPGITRGSPDGPPHPGETLTLDTGEFTPGAGDGTQVSVQWLRGGTPVPGATGTTYRLRRADLGTHVVAEVTLTRPGYTDLATRSGRTRLVRSAPRVRVVGEPLRHRVRTTVTVHARGANPVAGTVRVRWHHTVLAEKPLRAGGRVLNLRDLPSGRQTVRVRFLGSRTVRPRTVVRHLRVP